MLGLCGGAEFIWSMKTSDVCWPFPFPVSVDHFHFLCLLTTSISQSLFDLHSHGYASMNNLNFWVFTSVVVQVVVIFCAMCWSFFWCFRGTYCLHPQGDWLVRMNAEVIQWKARVNEQHHCIFCSNQSSWPWGNTTLILAIVSCWTVLASQPDNAGAWTSS